jgi:cytoskeletal protein CcmA (bactofilin family)
MPPRKQEKVPVPCPHCGHSQQLPATAITSVCKECGRHFDVHGALHPKPKKQDTGPEKRSITCFDCGTELKVPLAAESTMCKKCSQHIDLRDYHIANAVSKNFRTKGIFVVEQKGYVFNTEVLAREAAIKGRFLGKIKTEGPLTIHTGAEIKGTLHPGLLVIPAKNVFHWPNPINVGSAEISGELNADLLATGTVVIKSTGIYFGDIKARHLVVEPGAVIVGNMFIAEPPPPPPPAALPPSPRPRPTLPPAPPPKPEPPTSPVKEKKPRAPRTKAK